MVPTRSELYPGLQVSLVQKHHQSCGTETRGFVANILTSSGRHPHGIKVRLTSGIVGRVQSIVVSGSSTGAADKSSAMDSLIKEYSYPKEEAPPFESTNTAQYQSSSVSSIFSSPPPLHDQDSFPSLSNNTNGKPKGGAVSLRSLPSPSRSPRRRKPPSAVVSKSKSEPPVVAHSNEATEQGQAKIQEEHEWQCAACTFFNQPTWLCCDMCGGEKSVTRYFGDS